MAFQLTTAGKARVAVAGLAALLLWPPVHWHLVETRAIDPWKFFGFAMYCRPSIPPRIDVRVLAGGRTVSWSPAEWPSSARPGLARFLRDRQILGDWRKPNDLAEAIFRMRPDAEQVLLIVRHPRIDRSTGLVTDDEFRYGYVRPR